MDINRLNNILNNTKLQTTNNALYQLLNSLLTQIKEQQVIIDQLTSVTGIDTTVTTASLVGKTMTFTDGKLTKFI